MAFDLDRDDWRTFRLDRVTSAVSTGLRSTRREAPDPVEMVQRGIAVEAWDHRAEVILDVDADSARRHIPANVGAIEARGKKRSVLVIGADEIGWIARYLLSLPFGFEVVEPVELRERLAEIGTSLSSDYGHG